MRPYGPVGSRLSVYFSKLTERFGRVFEQATRKWYPRQGSNLHMTGFEDRCLNPVWRLGCLPGRGQAGKVVFLEGSEPPTSDFVEQRSIQLSYRNILVAACTRLRTRDLISS